MTGTFLAPATARMVFIVVGLSCVALLVSPSGVAREPEVKMLVKDVAYPSQPSAEPSHGQTLDLYGPDEKPASAMPVVLFVHGGGWRHGDKAMVGRKPLAFVERGFLFATANYRLDGSVSPREQAGDVAQAVKWLHDHVGEHGGDPGKIFLMGHSAGAHLVALVGTDERLLEAYGLGLEAVRGVVLLDGAGYDVPKQVAAARLPMLKELYRNAFGDDPDAQREASPVGYAVAGKSYPAFLAFHFGQRRDSREQSELLVGKLRDAGAKADTVHEPDKNHLTLNRELGMAGDGPTGKIFGFLEDVLGAGRAGP